MSIYIKKTIGLITIVSSLLVINACMPRHTDGSYHSLYSYHPYEEMQTKQAKPQNNTYSIHNEMRQTYKKPKASYPDDNPPSNVPRNSHI